MMITVDVKSDLPRTDVADKRLIHSIKYYRSKEKVIKILHGYGSTGVGGNIKVKIHQTLSKMVTNQEIKGFIPGESIGNTIGFDHVISTYKHLIQQDSDFKRNNYGITYVIL